MSSHADLVYTPSRFDPDKAGLVVVLHGCLQSAESMALGTGWNQIADDQNLAILYPQVPKNSHPLNCWAWYRTENQRADSGQLKDVADRILATQKSLNLKAPRVFVTGLSSGAATAAGLLACFPHLFTAGALHSGPSYGLAANEQEAQKVLRDGPPAKSVELPCQPKNFHGELLVIQGTQDKVVHPLHGARIIKDFGGKGRLVMVSGLDHAWSGYTSTLGPHGKFPTRLPFFSEIGPSATDLIWDFFRKSP